MNQKKSNENNFIEKKEKDNQKYNLTVKEAADILNCSSRTIYRKLHKNKIDGIKRKVKTGQKWFINEKSLNEAVKKNEVVEIKEINEEIAVDQFKAEFSDLIKKTVREEVKSVIKEENDEQKNEIRKIIKEEMQQALEENKKDQEEKEEKKIWDKIKSFFK